MRLTDSMVMGSLLACASSLVLSPSRYDLFLTELVGTLLTVCMVIGSNSLVGMVSGLSAYVGAYEAGLIFCVSIVAIDRLVGGPKNNPIFSLTMVVWGQSEVLDAIIEIAGQVAGGILGYPILSSLAKMYKKKMGGPACDLATTDLQTAAISEAASSFLLVTIVACLGMTRIGKVYWVKQPAIAAGIRAIVNQAFFAVTGPGMNPVLPTTYAFFANSTWPTDWEHYFIYWASAAVGGLAAAVLFKIVLGIDRPAEVTKAKKKD